MNERRLFQKITETLEDYAKGNLSGGFVYFDVPDGVVVPKVMGDDFVEKASFAKPLADFRSYQKNQHDLEKLFIFPKKYKCDIGAHTQLMIDLNPHHGKPMPVQACMSFIKACPDTLLAQLLATRLIPSRNDIGLSEEDGKMLDRAYELQIDRHFYRPGSSESTFSPTTTSAPFSATTTTSYAPVFSLETEQKQERQTSLNVKAPSF